MWKKRLMWLLVLCLLPVTPVYAQGMDQLTWTVEALAERVTLTKQRGDLPVYTPKAPVVGTAIYVDRLERETEDALERSLALRGYILDRMGGVLEFTQILPRFMD